MQGPEIQAENKESREQVWGSKTECAGGAKAGGVG